MNLPAELLEYFFDHVNQGRPCAYLRLDAEKRLEKCGGALDDFRIAQHDEGAYMGEHLGFLAGITHPLDVPFVLKSVILSSGVSANVHVISDAGGFWVLLLDRQGEREYQQEIQQRINQVALTYELEHGKWPSSVLSRTLSRLNLTVFERIDEGWYRVVGGVSPELSAMYPDLLDAPESLAPGERFPFLGNFLIDAEPFWAGHHQGSIKSGVWVPQGVHDNDLSLEATAMCVGEQKILLIELTYHQQKPDNALLQTARVASLNYTRLLKEVQKKEILLHCIIHDLKQPLTTMSGSFSCLEIFDGEGLPAEAREFIHMGLAASQQQNRMIADILDAFSADMKAMEEFNPADADIPDLRDLVHSVCERQRASYSLKQVGIETLLPDNDGAPCLAQAESPRLHRVFANFMENALRYSPVSSAVTLRVEETEDAFVVSIEDQGPGVPADVAPRLFDKFAQGKGTAGSTGLGLYFCRIMVERWGGEIGYRRLPEQGSCFWFKLPKFEPQAVLDLA